MKLINKISDLNQDIASSSLTIGTFDGMHKGHYYLIENLKKIAEKNNNKSILITFNPNPRTILGSIDSRDYHIINNKHRLSLLEDLKIDIVLDLKFNRKLSQVTAEKFLKNYIITPFKPSDIVIGYDHHFGYKREGDNEFLNLNQSKYGYNLHEIKPLKNRGEIISSSSIRKLIITGKILNIHGLLGRNHQVSGKVEKGSEIGRQISFPTANISISSINQLIPGNGVYMIKARVDGRLHYGMCNIGFKPTFNNSQNKTMEVHLFNYDKYDLYSQFINIEFVDYIRCEKKFRNKDDLKEQLTRDKEYCMNILN